MSDQLEALNYRPAQISDITRLLELEQQIVDSERPYDPAIREQGVTYYDFHKLISDPNTYLLVVGSGPDIIATGYAQMRSSRDCHTHDIHCYLGFIYTDPAYRGKGIAGNIIDKLKDWSIERDVHSFYLDVYAANEIAIRAYQKVGFSKSTIKMELLPD